MFLNHETGKRMSYLELCIYIKKKADESPRILNLLLDHCIGKPVEYVHHRIVPTFNIIDSTEPSDNAEDAEVVEEDKFSVPFGMVETPRL